MKEGVLRSSCGWWSGTSVQVTRWLAQELTTTKSLNDLDVGLGLYAESSGFGMTGLGRQGRSA
jgi:hypothetical protein